MTMVDRITRISEQVKKEIGRIIKDDLKDPRLPSIVSVISASVTRDLRYARVEVSVLGNEEDKKNAMEALTSASGFIRREVGRRIKLRHTPEIHFVISDSIEQGIYISKLIDEAVKKDDKTL